MPYYGGEITDEEWANNDWKHSIQINYNGDLSIFRSTCIKNLVTFHTREQLNRFLSFPENVQLVKDLYMVD